tara:strand:- start:509 stop:955 length:447 start_codon:yes stop_codon:yes gene_type:complete
MALVKLYTKTKRLVGTGVLLSEWTDGAYGHFHIQTEDGQEVSLSNRYYSIVETDIDPNTQDASDASDAPVTDGDKVGELDPGANIQPAPSRPKSKDKLSDEDIERIVSKISDVSLVSLKSIGLKSGELYPLMIKINSAIKMALTPTEG